MFSIYAMQSQALFSYSHFLIILPIPQTLIPNLKDASAIIQAIFCFVLFNQINHPEKKNLEILTMLQGERTS